MHAPVKVATLASVAVAQAAGLKPCDCLKSCGDDSDIDAGKATPCQNHINWLQAEEDARQLKQDGHRFQELRRVLTSASTDKIDNAYREAFADALTTGQGIIEITTLLDSCIASRAIRNTSKA